MQQLDDEEALKTAALLYQQSANYFNLIKNNNSFYSNDLTLDLLPETLSLLTKIMLAQSQEIIYLKAIKSNCISYMNIAKLTAECSDLYTESNRLISSYVGLMKKFHKSLSPILDGKQKLYQGLTQYYQAKHDYKEKNIGKSLSRLLKSIELLKLAEKCDVKSLNIQNCLNKVLNDYDKIKNENELIYHERLIEFNMLEKIEKASMAKITLIKDPISKDFNDLFANLYPIRPHNIDIIIGLILIVLIVILLLFFVSNKF